MIKTTTAIAAAALLCLSAGTTLAQEMTEFRIGLLGGENEQDRLRSSECLRASMEEALGVPAKLFPSPDYAGVLQGLLGGTLEFAELGASGYAGIYLENPDAVEPLVHTEQLDGSRGYYSVLYVRADSDFQTLDDLKGASIGFADPNSTSGYLIPAVDLPNTLGMPVEEFFGETGFGGGHEQTVIAVLNKQFDAGVTWTSGIGEYSEGYTAGNLRKMVDKDMLDMNDIRILWRSNLIPNGPVVIRQDVPQEVKDTVLKVLLELPQTDPECFYSVSGGDRNGYVEVDHEAFKTIVDARRSTIEQD